MKNYQQQMFLHDDEGTQLIDNNLKQVKEALLMAKTQKEKYELLTHFKFDIGDFEWRYITAFDDLMIACEIKAHLQRSGDYFCVHRSTIDRKKKKIPL